MVDEVADFQTEPVQGREPGYIVSGETVLLSLTKPAPDLQIATIDFARWSKESFATCVSSIEVMLGLSFKRKIEQSAPKKGMRLSFVHHSVTFCVSDPEALPVLEQALTGFCQTFHRAARDWFHDVSLVAALEPVIREVEHGVFTFSWKQRIESSTERSVRPADRPEEEVRG